MKKIIKILASLSLSCAMCAGVLSMTACYSTASYTGEYSYESWGTVYGIKVSVTVQTDAKGDRIRKVEVLPSEYVEASPEGTGQGEWPDNKLWVDGLDGLLLAYRGRYLADVLAVETVMNGYQPDKVLDEDLLISGATLGSGRLLLAVQGALKDAAESLGYKFYEGEYGYVSWGTNYGVKVVVAVKDGVIMGVNTVTSDYVEASDGWEGKKNWDDNVERLLESYRGRTVVEVKAVTVPVSDDGAPLATDKGGLSDDGYLVSGATLGSGRLLLAVQNALAVVQ